jgi:adenylate cyclase
MADLIAQGRQPQDRWRRTLPEPGTSVFLGRVSSPWAVGWDDRISRRHASIHWNGSGLEVTRLPESRNAIFYQGKQCDQFTCKVGEHFVIGQTTFTVLDQQVHFSLAESPALAEHTFSAQALRQNKYKEVGRRIEVLSKLPDIITSATDDRELCSRVVNLLMEGVPHATFVAILRSQRVNSADAPVNTDNRIAVPTDLEVLHWDCRGLNWQHFSPSAGLVRTASQTRESILHIWNRSIAETSNFTESENVDWAFCTPVLADSCPGWAIYVAGDFPSSAMFTGQQPGAEWLQDDLKFTELAATTLGALRQARFLQRRQDSLRNFFAPVVLDALAGHDPETVLSPRETEVSVLFCDLRGFTRQSESADHLLDLLQRVSDALGVMTHHILAGDGVVGDFHGDAAMGFWGWPLSDDRDIEKTCMAALKISHQFDVASADPTHHLANFRAGLGIASGSAVAGRIGTVDQVKVTVFGPVVNLASRLEGMTKQLQASILVDEATAQWIRQNVQPTKLRVRRVAKVLPYGMEFPLIVSQLLPPAGADCILTDAHIHSYEAALDRFIDGDWQDAFRLLHDVPAEDQVKDFITFMIAQHHRTAPPGWDGVVRLPSK